MMNWTIRTTLDWATAYFSKKEIASPRLDAELLLAKALGLSRVRLYMNFDRPLNPDELAELKALIQRRSAREPLAYILGKREFYSLDFHVAPSVLIPRPETEELVETALQHLQAQPSENPDILDLATGSGCVLIALLKNRADARGLGIDLSEAALGVAMQNAQAHGVEARSRWVRRDLSAGWPAEAEGAFDLITANLPYVSEAEWQGLMPEVKDFEPRIALVPGPSGEESFLWILPFLEAHLKSPGLALLEIGSAQGPSLQKQAQQFCPSSLCEIQTDLSGRDRFLRIRKDKPIS